LLVASAPVLAACDGKGDAAQRAADRFNGGDAPVRLREFIDRSGAISSCRIATRPGQSDQFLLTVISETGGWLQATIDPDETLPSHDVTVGGNFDSQTEAEYRSRGEPCRVSAEDGSVSLE
jgi:hypothetical protein